MILRGAIGSYAYSLSRHKHGLDRDALRIEIPRMLVVRCA
jgi:hypothetical protein